LSLHDALPIYRSGLGVDPVQVIQIVHDKMAQNQTVGFQNNLHFPDLLSENFAFLPSPPEIPTRSAKIKKPREKPAANLPSVEIERRLLIPAGFSASSPESLPPLRSMAWKFARRPFPMATIPTTPRTARPIVLLGITR